jgi:hypothetical protein
MISSQKHNAILISIIIGIIYSVATDKWIFDHLRARPDISFFAYAFQYLLLPSLIFLCVGGLIGYSLLWVFNRFSNNRHIIPKVVVVGLLFGTFCLLVVAGAEVYFWVIASGCNSC